jgi:hypothetical protein
VDGTGGKNKSGDKGSLRVHGRRMDLGEIWEMWRSWKEIGKARSAKRELHHNGYSDGVLPKVVTLNTA